MLTLSTGDLRRRTNLSAADVLEALDTISKATYPKYDIDTTALKMYESKGSSNGMVLEFIRYTVYVQIHILTNMARWALIFCVPICKTYKHINVLLFILMILYQKLVFHYLVHTYTYTVFSLW